MKKKKKGGIGGERKRERKEGKEREREGGSEGVRQRGRGIERKGEREKSWLPLARTFFTLPLNEMS